jgi:hypothetical protein
MRVITSAASTEQELLQDLHDEIQHLAAINVLTHPNATTVVVAKPPLLTAFDDYNEMVSRHFKFDNTCCMLWTGKRQRLLNRLHDLIARSTPLAALYQRSTTLWYSLTHHRLLMSMI